MNIRFAFAIAAVLIFSGCDRLPGRPSVREEIARPEQVLDFNTLYKENCAGCHGADGSKAIPAMGVKPLNTAQVKGKSEAQLADIVLKGQGKMKPQAVSPDEAKAVAGFVKTLK